MSKRLLALITVLLMLTVSSVAYGQEPTTDEPIFVLTEEQINAEFTIPSTATRTVSNVEVDVQEDGIHISFALTTIRDGTSNTLSIIAILIGLVQQNGSAVELENVQITSYLLEDGILVTAPSNVQREVNRLVGRAWRNYMRDAFAGRVGGKMHLEDISMGLFDDGIYVYETEGVTAQWCLECARP